VRFFNQNAMDMIKKKFFGLAFLFLLSLRLAAIEGMWLPMLLADLNEAEMKAMGFQLTAEDVYSANQSSLKDAIISFGGFCTGEVISPRGLILTNHHCGYGQIQKHSSVSNDLLRNGFWAKGPDQELTNPGLTATFVKYMEDVTNQVLYGMPEGLTGEAREAYLRERFGEVISDHGEQQGYKYFIRPFFHGNQYILFATEVFEDVRLVGAPPSSIGKYGADTDNWMFPRHTGDFALFRIYANANNMPAKPAATNVPYQAPRHLTINTGGVKDGDFTMVFGFPGRTDQYLPGVAVKQIMEVINPASIGIRDVLLSQLDRRMRISDEVRIQYAAKYASISNAWKKWKGENTGLRESNALGRKADYERTFMERVNANPEWQVAYGQILTQFTALYDEYEPWVVRQTYFNEIAFRGLEAMRMAWGLHSLENATADQRADNASRMADRLDDFYKDYNHEVQSEAMAALLALYYDNLPANHRPKPLVDLHQKYKGNWERAVNALTKKSVVATASPGSFSTLLRSKPERAIKALKKDAFYNFTKAMYLDYLNTVQPEASRINDAISDLKSLYMKAQLEIFPERRFYPDANSTLRVSYGKKEPYHPRDAVTYNTQTYLDGVMEKYIPGDYEFDLPERLVQLFEAKDFGPYADETGKVPVCFIASNHTTGGNSGSPALDGKGRLIGLNFDRVWEGTMSDINYDINRCRNVMVDVRYILFVVDKFAEAGYLLEEMTLENDYKN
jgi:hypothetical protein